MLVVLIRAMDDEITNGGGIIAAQCALEGSHARIFQRAIEHDVVEEVHAQEIRSAQIRHDTAADRVLAMAGAAILIEQGFAPRDGRRIGRLRRRIDDEWHAARAPAMTPCRPV